MEPVRTSKCKQHVKIRDMQMDKYTRFMRMYKRDVLEVHNLFHQELSGKRKVCAKQAEKKKLKIFKFS